MNTVMSDATSTLSAVRATGRTPRCVIVGAGLTGATTAWSLRRHGVEVTVRERSTVVGGHIRNEWIAGVPYEPNGAHIFHTDDDEVWDLARSLVEFAPYEHQVRTRIGTELLSWPPQLTELAALPEWHVIEKELAARPEVPDASNFERYCVSIMGETIYQLFIAGYTEKQWGRRPDRLSAEFAPKRVELRTDGYLGLFRDPHQGWPREGYTSLVEALLAGIEVELASNVTLENLATVAEPGTAVVLTGPLDDFFGDAEGQLEWRGVRLVPKVIPEVVHAQPCMVVNEPSPEVAYTRTIESKHVFPHLSGQAGTVVCFEYPGADAKHYPVYDADGMNRGRQHAYEARAAAVRSHHLVPAGRLARYVYINMDEAMRQGLDAAAEVLEWIRAD